MPGPDPLVTRTQARSSVRVRLRVRVGPDSESGVRLSVGESLARVRLVYESTVIAGARRRARVCPGLRIALAGPAAAWAPA
jgi:hypothetical protein